MRCEDFHEQSVRKNVECVIFQIKILCAYRKMAKKWPIFAIPVFGSGRTKIVLIWHVSFSLDFWGNVQFNLLKPTGYVMHQQFNTQQLYVLPTLYLCVFYLPENKQRLVPLTA